MLPAAGRGTPPAARIRGGGGEQEWEGKGYQIVCQQQHAQHYNQMATRCIHTRTSRPLRRWCAWSAEAAICSDRPCSALAVLSVACARSASSCRAASCSAFLVAASSAASCTRNRIKHKKRLNDRPGAQNDCTRNVCMICKSTSGLLRFSHLLISCLHVGAQLLGSCGPLCHRHAGSSLCCSGAALHLGQQALGLLGGSAWCGHSMLGSNTSWR